MNTYRQLSILAGLLVMLLCGTVVAVAQAPVSSDKAVAEAKKIKEKVTKIGIGGEITVSAREGKTFHGAVSQINLDTFIVSEVDLKANVELRYDQVKKVEKGYSKPNNFTGHRMSPKTRKILAWSVVGFLAVMIGIIIKGLNDPNF